VHERSQQELDPSPSDDLGPEMPPDHRADRTTARLAGGSRPVVTNSLGPESPPSLAPLTTLRVGGPARSITAIRSRQDLVAAVRAAPDPTEPDSFIVLGGGSNVVVSDAGFRGDVLLLRGGTIRRSTGDKGVERFYADAGARWDDLVAASVDADCTGLEMMSGVPGSVGAAPMQNIAAYGQQVGDVIEHVDVLDRRTLATASIPGSECGFGFRTSRFKGDWLDRYVILGVTFGLRSAAVEPPEPSSYVDVVKHFERHGGNPLGVADRRRAVLATRARKSMLLDDSDPDARSVGSFFINPSVPVALAERLAGEFQTIGLTVQYLESRAELDPTRRRIPAAHVLRYSGFNAGDSWGAVRLSSKHVLALVTTPDATATDVWNVGNHMRTVVEQATGVQLSFEAGFVGEFPPFDDQDFSNSYVFEPAPAQEPDWLTSYR
jgi:UDP-N-acetylmuramate dehydrogenase